MAPWPTYDAELAHQEEYEIVIQVNARVRGRLRESAELHEKELLQQALADPGVPRLVVVQRIAETVVVPKKLINLVLAP